MPKRLLRNPNFHHDGSPPAGTDNQKSGRVGSSDSTGCSEILLVDDDPAVLEGLRRVLESDGWSVTVASSGEEALYRLQRSQPGLMITDLSMAGVNGWDLLFHERLQHPELAVFVITALPVSAIGGAERFAQEFFQKPVDLDAMLDAVGRYLGRPKRKETSTAG